jgi:glycosyltransferase involved in cell wall biosynthesis
VSYKNSAYQKIGIDASRSISGGAIEHLRGILLHSSYKVKKIKKVYLWAPSNTLIKLPNHSWLEKISTDFLGKFIFKKLFWQFFILPRICKKLSINLLFNTSAGSLCLFKPSVTLLQDIMPFEKKIISKYKFYQISLYRNLILRFVFIRCLKSTNHIIFLSKYSKKAASNYVKINNYTIIPHGVDKSFYKVSYKKIIKKKNYSINALYISNALIYKNQWNVIAAIAEIRKRYQINIKLKIVGGGSGLALKKMNRSKLKYDNNNKFVKLFEFSNKNKIKTYYQNSHIFIFASSAEAFGITLLEAMSVGIPIACSNKSSMPEIIKNNTIYFNPENVEEIILAIIKILTNDQLRNKIAIGAKIRSKHYTWKKSARLTWQILNKFSKSDSMKKKINFNY